MLEFHVLALESLVFKVKSLIVEGLLPVVSGLGSSDLQVLEHLLGFLEVDVIVSIFLMLLETVFLVDVVIFLLEMVIFDVEFMLVVHFSLMLGPEFVLVGEFTSI